MQTKPECLIQIGGSQKNEHRTFEGLTPAQAEASRNVRCNQYRDCLNYAANHNWDSFVCHELREGVEIQPAPKKLQFHRRLFCALPVRRKLRVVALKNSNIRLAEILNQHQISLTQLYRDIGRTQGAISQILKNGRTKISTAQKIRDYINGRTGREYTVDELFRRL